MKTTTKKHRKIISLIIFACILIILAITIRYWVIDSKTPNFPSFDTKSSITSDEKELRLLSGAVADTSMNTITVLSDTEKTYSFEKSAQKLEVSNGDVIIGCPVTVYYYGSLDETLNIQNVQIDKITVDGSFDKNVRARQILDSMSLEEKVGQMFIVRCPKDNAAQSVSKYHLGGYILFSRDFNGKTRSEVSSDIQSYQNASKIGMLVSVDEEGGTVNRVSLYKQFRAVPFWSQQDLYAKGGWDLIISDTKEKAELLKSIGININMAPVCDVSTDKSDYIFARSFGKSAALTAQYTEKVVSTMCDNQLGSVLKHFPGYGNNTNTHTGVSYDNRSYETFVNSDFLPFISGINAGAGAVLVSHNIVACMDPENPASLSPKVHQILREELKFNGVIMTDDLYMDAIRKFAGEGKAAVMAVPAGNDMVCCTDFEKQIPPVIEAINNKTISESGIDKSVLRILCWKLSMGIIK